MGAEHSGFTRPFGGPFDGCRPRLVPDDRDVTGDNHGPQGLAVRCYLSFSRYRPALQRPIAVAETALVREHKITVEGMLMPKAWSRWDGVTPLRSWRSGRWRLLSSCEHDVHPGFAGDEEGAGSLQASTWTSAVKQGLKQAIPARPWA
jgi:hypothetical protein